MALVCHDKCSRYVDTYGRLVLGTSLIEGQPAKYCAICVYFRYTSDILCPCCANKYRVKSTRNNKIVKKQGNEIITEKEYNIKLLDLLSLATLQ